MISNGSFGISDSDSALKAILDYFNLGFSQGLLRLFWDFSFCAVNGSLQAHSHYVSSASDIGSIEIRLPNMPSLDNLRAFPVIQLALSHPLLDRWYSVSWLVLIK
jgi:hypothetical protein